MTLEWNQIRRWLAIEHGLEGEWQDGRFVVPGPVPDGTHRIPIGTPPVGHTVHVRGGRIFIEEP